MKRTATDIAHSAGATADVTITRGYDVTVNDTLLASKMTPTLQRVAGAGKFRAGQPSAAGEDFSKFAAKAPGMFVSLGVTPPAIDWRTAASNHSPLFQGDDAALPIGVRIMTNLAVEYLRFGRTQ
jgi:amidohydrolase